MTNTDPTITTAAHIILNHQGGTMTTALQTAQALADAGLLMPDLPAPDNSYPEWLVGGVSISPGPDAGEVAIEWEDREDTGRGTVTRSLYLAPDQVCALLAAAEQVRAALKEMEEA